MTGMSYPDLVATATVGVARRPVQVTELAGPAAEHAGVLDREDPAIAVLDAAALLVTARRAGVRPATGLVCPAPAGRDTAPELPARAAEVLATAGVADLDLLADLLAAAAASGYLAPAPMLPALLDAAAKYPAVREAVAGVLGARGRWLAGHRADWRKAIDAVAPAVPGDPEVWQTGSRGDRHAYLAMVRDRDPAAARELLAASWPEETGADRADLLAILRHGLGAADEEFLERALDDRKAAVRTGARALLALLPGSAFSRRAAERALPLLLVERSGLRHRLAATLPGGADGAALRDGISSTPPTAEIGARAWLLTQLVAAAPLTGWVARFGLDPQRLVSLPVSGDLAVEVHAGWRLAAVRQASPAWARALLTAAPLAGTGERPPSGTAQRPPSGTAQRPPSGIGQRPPSGIGQRPPSGTAQRPPAAWPPDRELAAVLPPGELAELAMTLLTGQANLRAGIAAAMACPPPWPGALADQVMALLERAFAAGHWSGTAESLLQAAVRCLPTEGPRDYAAALARLALFESCPPRWPDRLRRAARAVALRRTFHEEIR
jgi:hypothetical protein